MGWLVGWLVGLLGWVGVKVGSGFLLGWVGWLGLVWLVALEDEGIVVSKKSAIFFHCNMMVGKMSATKL